MDISKNKSLAVLLACNNPLPPEVAEHLPALLQESIGGGELTRIPSRMYTGV